MFLSAWPMAAPAGTLQLWVGVFDVDPLPNTTPTFSIGKTTLVLTGAPNLQPISDWTRGQGKSFNYFGVFSFDLMQLPADARHKAMSIEIKFATAVPISVPTKALPDSLDDGFTILLSSCYYHENQARGLASIAHMLQDWPDMVLLAGDQVYLDNPLLEVIPKTQPALSQKFGDKYAKNFIRPGSGLRSLLTLAPTACIPDDHELWNNYPSPSITMVGSRDPAIFKRLRDAARALYDDYQQGGPNPSGTQRLQIGPLHMLFADTRLNRTSKTTVDGLFGVDTEKALVAWKNALLNAHKAKQLAIGVLACGQILLAEPEALDLLDANLQNYRQFSVIADTIRQLANAGVPVLFLSGDIHFSRVTAATYQKTDHQCLFEVISSPSSLLPGTQGTPKEAPKSFDGNRFKTEAMELLKGDVVTTLKFLRSGTGVQVAVTYYGLDTNVRTNKASCSFQMTPRF